MKFNYCLLILVLSTVCCHRSGDVDDPHRNIVHTGNGITITKIDGGHEQYRVLLPCNYYIFNADESIVHHHFIRDNVVKFKINSSMDKVITYFESYCNN